ncbi:MAG: hypothetical protein H7641_01780 [Candidatus Heimdallarchaeota archaeon]|nr:hypothetical protein [Candidatus Heimdallarchaeota archaeon]MCK4876293.1 hypothetical protein [Candidatus Heimdallarchaeota archaeon]
MFSYLEADVVPIILKVFRDNLCLQENEKVIIATDYARPKDMMIKPIEILERIIRRNFLARRIQEIAKENYPNNEIDLFCYPCPWEQYPSLDEEIKNHLLNYDLIYVISEFSIYKSFSSKELEKHEIKAAFSPGIETTLFLPEGPMDIDFQKLEREAMTLYSICKKAEKIRIYTDLGTEIIVEPNPKHIKYESGILSYPGKKANIPPGEVTISRANINGVYSIPKGWIEGISAKVKLEIKDSNIIAIQSDEESVRKIQRWFGGSLPYTINSLAIGLNENAKNPFSQLELEKMKGVANLAGTLKKQTKSPFEISTFAGHFPTPNIYLEIEEELVIKNGKLLF